MCSTSPSGFRAALVGSSGHGRPSTAYRRARRRSEPLWAHCTTGRDKPYAENQAEHMVRDSPFVTAFDGWTDAFARFVASKGKVEPSQWRAFGYEAPGHLWTGAKLKRRGKRMSIGHSPDIHRQRRRRGLASTTMPRCTGRRASAKNYGSDLARITTFNRRSASVTVGGSQPTIPRSYARVAANPGDLSADR